MLLSRIQQRAGCPPARRASPAQHQPCAAAAAPTRRRRSVACAAAAPAASAHQLALHLGDQTTIQLPLAPAQAQALDAALSKLLQTFADKQAAERPQRWASMEVRFAGSEAGEGLELIELFCNPNSFKTAFDAKLMITVRAAGGLKVSAEGRLSNVKADVDAYLADL